MRTSVHARHAAVNGTTGGALAYLMIDPVVDEPGSLSFERSAYTSRPPRCRLGSVALRRRVDVSLPVDWLALACAIGTVVALNVEWNMQVQVLMVSGLLFLASLVLSVLALILTYLTRPRGRGQLPALVALLVVAVIVLFFLLQAGGGSN
jgi:hypothetical protein